MNVEISFFDLVQSWSSVIMEMWANATETQSDATALQENNI